MQKSITRQGNTLTTMSLSRKREKAQMMHLDARNLRTPDALLTNVPPFKNLTLTHSPRAEDVM